MDYQTIIAILGFLVIIAYFVGHYIGYKSAEKDLHNSWD